MKKRRAISLLTLFVFMCLVSFANSAWAGKSGQELEKARESYANSAFAARYRQNNNPNSN